MLQYTVSFRAIFQPYRGILRIQLGRCLRGNMATTSLGSDKATAREAEAERSTHQDTLARSEVYSSAH